MGAISSQPAQRKGTRTVDPLESLNQKMAGRTQGKSLDGLSPGSKKKKTSLMGTLGNM